MRVFDKIYGEEEVGEEVLIDLINCSTIQRLKEISQYGLPQEYYHKKIFSRFDHSVGVLILLRRLGADLNEQIGGLLHDISHTAFSHVIDWVVGDPTKEDHQDNTFSEFLENKDITEIFEKYNIDKSKIVNVETFPLLEQEAPSLCADRIDYTLREMWDFNKKEMVKEIVKDLTVVNNQIVFKTKDNAEKFGNEYANLQREHWAGDEAKSRYYILSKILKLAMKNNLLNLEDFKKTDDYVINILKKSGDEKILEGLSLLRNGFRANQSEDGILLLKKFRYVDPEVLLNDSVVSLSTVSNDYSELLRKEKENSNVKVKVDIRAK
jgi:uncharacterized protein